MHREKNVMNKMILIVAGGTGGHIIPAISFGNWIKEHNPEFSLVYVCGSRSIEEEIYREYCIDPIVLPIAGSPLGKRNVISFCSRSIGIFKSILKARRLIEMKKPSRCILFGGYTSFPVLLAALSKGVTSIVHEQNTRAGKLTRIAFKLKTKVLAGWEECDPLPMNAYETVGIPVRKFNRLQDLEAWNILHVGSKVPEGPIIVVMGGSLGSKSVFRNICSIASMHEMKRITFLIVGGEDSSPGDVPSNVVLMGRFWDLSPVFSIADAAIIRAGASTLYEMATYGIPTIVVPWKGAADEHQEANAQFFVRQYGGFVWNEDDSALSLMTQIRNVIQIKRPLSDAEKDAKRVRVNQKIWEEMFLTTGREIL